MCKIMVKRFQCHLKKRQDKRICISLVSLYHKSHFGSALALANFSFCLSSGLTVKHYCHGLSIFTHLKPVQNLF